MTDKELKGDVKVLNKLVAFLIGGFVAQLLINIYIISNL